MPRHELPEPPPPDDEDYRQRGDLDRLGDAPLGVDPDRHVLHQPHAGLGGRREADEPVPTRNNVTPVVLLTEDGGATWTDRAAPLRASFPNGEWGWKIQFLDDKVGFVSLENFNAGAILKTTDGGETWTRLPINDPQANANLEGVGFIDKDHGWVGGWGDAQFQRLSTSQTADGGQTWTNADDVGKRQPLPLLRHARHGRLRLRSDRLQVLGGTGRPRAGREPADPRGRSRGRVGGAGVFCERPARHGQAGRPDLGPLRRPRRHPRRREEPGPRARTLRWDSRAHGGQPLAPGYFIVRGWSTPTPRAN